ncbi:hypothetical protein F1B92_08365 [Campylobacter sp. FMV-PI01]|uniref:Type II toxin-antitoxin system RelE/ParE family toxin n=1 Tax=Campylobacter portucalensis TaxID=2608384 RepID=A0A6L5WND9_9BACT|nr:type II toxin-antitoxin system RelE/ParE family toxin [Campylobacter portucalensis]MSN97171.1 hypothetical protein [Campylobacter portucalensis]
MYKVKLKKSADKQLEKIAKGDKISALKIRTFLNELEKEKDPFTLKNALKMSGYENIYRWKIGLHYRIIGIKEDEILTIEIIEITSRENAYKK